MKPLIDVLQAVNDVLYRIVHWVVRLAPAGVFAILAAVVGRSGLDILGDAALVRHGLPDRHRGARGRGPRHAAAAVGPPAAREAAAGVARAAAHRLRLGLDGGGASGVHGGGSARNRDLREGRRGSCCPSGAAAGRDSSGIYQVVSVVAIAQLVGRPLDMGELGLLWVTAILSSLAVSGVPAASFVNLTILLGALGLPVTLSALVLAVERPLDHLRTTGNLIARSPTRSSPGPPPGRSPPGEPRGADEGWLARCLRPRSRFVRRGRAGRAHHPAGASGIGQRPGDPHEDGRRRSGGGRHPERRGG